MKRKSEASFSESRPYAAQHPGEAPMYRWVGPSRSGTIAPHPTHAFSPGCTSKHLSPLVATVPAPQGTLPHSYSPTFGEGEFSEVELRLYGVLRSSLPLAKEIPTMVPIEGALASSGAYAT